MQGHVASEAGGHASLPAHFSPESRYPMPEAVATPEPAPSKRKRRTADELRTALQERIKALEDRDKLAAKKLLTDAAASIAEFVAKFPTTRAGTFATQANGLLQQAISAM